MKIENFDSDACHEKMDEITRNHDDVSSTVKFYSDAPAGNDGWKRKCFHSCCQSSGAEWKRRSEKKFEKSLRLASVEDGEISCKSNNVPVFLDKNVDFNSPPSSFFSGEEHVDVMSYGGKKFKLKESHAFGADGGKSTPGGSSSTSDLGFSISSVADETPPSSSSGPTSSPTSSLSKSFPSSSMPCFLTLPQHGTAASLPPSPLLQPQLSSSLLERRRNKTGKKSPNRLTPISAVEQENQLQCSSPVSSHHHHHHQRQIFHRSKYDHPAGPGISPLQTPTSVLPFPVKVLPNLYLGNADTSSDLECLEKHNISYIVNVTSDVPNSFEDRSDFCYMRIPIVDNSWSLDMENYFRRAIDFIDEGRQRDQSVLVHCMAGMSRSVTVTVAYLMKSENLSMDDAYDLLKGCKSNINPHLSLMGQLAMFGDKLKNEKQFSNLSLCEDQLSYCNNSSTEVQSCRTTSFVNSFSTSSALITPETATTKPEQPGPTTVFDFSYTPPATPSSTREFL